MRPPTFGYPGSKAKLAPWISNVVPNRPGLIYVEPFAGRANVFFYLRAKGWQFESWHLNDKVTHSWLNAIKLVDPDDIRSFHCHPMYVGDEIRQGALKGDPLYEVLFAAFAFGGGIPARSTIGLMKESYTLDGLAKRVELAKQLLEDVIITSHDGIELIEQSQDNQFLYVDPPYRGIATAAYAAGSDEFYIRLYKGLKECSASWVLSEYANELVVDILGPPNYQKEGKSTAMPGDSKTYGKKKVECLWTNVR